MKGELVVQQGFPYLYNTHILGYIFPLFYRMEWLEVYFLLSLFMLVCLKEGKSLYCASSSAQSDPNTQCCLRFDLLSDRCV